MILTHTARVLVSFQGEVMESCSYKLRELSSFIISMVINATDMEHVRRQMGKPTWHICDTVLSATLLNRCSRNRYF